MGSPLSSIAIKGFKSIEKLDRFPLGSLNVLIGANGAGKSNFVEFFRLLRALVEQRLQTYLNEHGPADGYFFNGVAHSKQLTAEMIFGDNRYEFTLKPTADGRVFVDRELTQYLKSSNSKVIAQGTAESKLRDVKDEPGLSASFGPNWYVWNAVSSWRVYHFHDTSMTAGMRREAGVEQSLRLAPNGENLAAYILKLRDENTAVYQALRQTIQRVAPYFDDFAPNLRRNKTEDLVRLLWKQKGKDYLFSPGHLSDGTIRFICLATVLMQPNPPSTIVLDEPELGLHPEALAILGGLLRSASQQMQVIISTQSPLLLNEFGAEQVITVDQVNGATGFSRLDKSALDAWLAEYSVSDLWQKGVIHGGVNHA